jgi:hypothetical protein
MSLTPAFTVRHSGTPLRLNLMSPHPSIHYLHIHARPKVPASVRIARIVSDRSDIVRPPFIVPGSSYHESLFTIRAYSTLVCQFPTVITLVHRYESNHSLSTCLNSYVIFWILWTSLTLHTIELIIVPKFRGIAPWSFPRTCSEVNRNHRFPPPYLSMALLDRLFLW